MEKVFHNFQNWSSWIIVTLIISTATLGTIQISTVATLTEISNRQDKEIETIKKNYVSTDLFILFAQTYETQLEEVIAIKTEDVSRVQETQKKYRELRTNILKLTTPQTRGN